MPDMKTLIIIIAVAAVTALLRFLPFLIFGKNRKTPPVIEKLSRILPFAVMGMLCVYCLKDISFSSISGFIPELVASLTVVLLYVIKRNTLISIVAGTLLYMFLVQFIF